jgi:hypothetical protein
MEEHKIIPWTGGYVDIKCYDINLNILGIVDDFISFNFQRSYSNIGEWQLVLDANTLNAQRVKNMEVISLTDGVAGLVTQHEENKEENQHTITYIGIELKGISTLRIIDQFAEEEAYQSYTNVSPEYVIAQIVEKQIINPVNNTNKAVAGSIANYVESADRINFSGRFDTPANAIQQIANAYNLGWHASLNENDEIVWYIYRGVDRTKNQSTNSRMIVSYALDSFGNSSISKIHFLPNVALVAGQGEGISRAKELVGNTTATGLNWVETYIDARDIKDDAELPARGAEKLAEYGDPLTYSTTFSSYFTQLYHRPFELGDVGTIIDGRLPNGEVDFRLTQVEEIYEGDQLRLDATFGYDRQGLIEKINRATGNTQSLIKLEDASVPNTRKINGYELSSDITLTATDVGLGNVPNINFLSGWFPVAETWTQTGNYTFTISGNVTDRYQAKDKFMCTQDGTVKYGFFVKVAYVSDTTTVTISQENILTSSEISSKYISKMATPQSFPYDKALLWAGSWASGNLTVAGINNFTKFIALMDGVGTALNVNINSIHWRGMGGYVSSTPTVVTYQVTATLSTETLTMVAARSVSHTASDVHTEYTPQTISVIYGLI